MEKRICYLFAAFCLVFLVNCNTSVKIMGDSTAPTSLSLNGQLLTIVYESTDLTKDFMVSFKNYLLRELQNKGIKAQLESEKGNLPSSYSLIINVENERGRNLPHLTGTIKQFRSATIDIELKNTEWGILRKNQLVVNHVYDSETTVTARKAAQKLVAELNLTY